MIDALGDVLALLMNIDEHDEVFRIVSDLFQNTVDQPANVDFLRTGDFARYKDFAFRRHNLTCNAGRFVHIQTLVQNGISDEITQFVRMSSSDAFGSLVFCHISFLS